MTAETERAGFAAPPSLLNRLVTFFACRSSQRFVLFPGSHALEQRDSLHEDWVHLGLRGTVYDPIIPVRTPCLRAAIGLLQDVGLKFRQSITRQARGEAVQLAAAIPDSPAQFTDKTPSIKSTRFRPVRFFSLPGLMLTPYITVRTGITGQKNQMSCS